MVDKDLETQFEKDAERWEALSHPIPDWFKKAKLGFFIHWGPYSVPAWGEPIGELGTIDRKTWYKHNPYAEWYFNTIRIDGSPAQKHHEEVYGGRDYDDFLDEWNTDDFDANAVVKELVDAGGQYLVLTTKHHDGVCLWDAPRTDGRNTVARGPHRDLVGDYVDACRAQGMRFGAYYSGGLDWHARPTDPIQDHGGSNIEERPNDREYASYAADHLRDLIKRYSPDILWNDINWPDEGKDFRDTGIGKVFEEYYAVNPDGLVNDRWEVPHSDYVTSEYQARLDNEASTAWENCRGIGLSFGYNAVEGPEHAKSGPEVAKHLVDTVTRGGRLLLGVGPKADGSLPDWQSKIVADLGKWMKCAGDILEDVVPTDETVPVNAEWVRFGEVPDGILAFIDSDEPVAVENGELLCPEWGTLSDGELRPAADRPGPVIVKFPKK